MIKFNAKLKGILFDLDGTIVDSTEAYWYAAKEASKMLKMDNIEDSMILEIPRRLEQKLSLDDIIEDGASKFLEVYLETFYTVTETMTRPLPNVAKTLEILSSKVKLALVTMRSFPSEKIGVELAKFGLSNYFSHIVTALDTNRTKPSPEALIKCMQALDVQICDCLMVGDSISDIRAGKAAGTMTVAVLSGLFNRQELLKENPDFIIKDISAITEFLSEHS